MISIIPIPITIAVAGLTHDSEVQKIAEGVRVIGWEFTTPNYTNAVTTSLSVISAAGRTLVSSDAPVNEDTASVKICAENEAAPVFSGFKLRATVSGATGGATPYTMNVILYVADGDDKAILVPSSFSSIMTFQHKPDSLLSQAAPVQNTWYTVLNTVSNIRLMRFAMGVADTNETLEMKITIDGNSYTGSQAAVAGNHYHGYVHFHDAGTIISFDTSENHSESSFPYLLEGRSIKVEVRKTTANGVGTITAAAQYTQRG